METLQTSKTLAIKGAGSMKSLQNSDVEAVKEAGCKVSLPKISEVPAVKEFCDMESLQLSEVPSIAKAGGKESLQIYEDDVKEADFKICTGQFWGRYLLVFGTVLIIGAIVAGTTLIAVINHPGQATLGLYGYQGSLCVTEIDECSSNPCMNRGLCKDKSNGYICECQPGSEGATCEIDIDECASNPCDNGGSCQDKLNGYICECQPGYEGATCETDINECASKPCGAVGRCHDNLNSYKCSCLDGSSGDTCNKHAALCTEAKTIRDPTRSICYSSKSHQCDRESNISQGLWYRFMGEGEENLVIPEYAPGPNACSTRARGWLNSSHPTGFEPDERTVCYQWNVIKCLYPTKIQTKRCDGFFIYKLYFFDGCNSRICTGDI